MLQKDWKLLNRRNLALRYSAVVAAERLRERLKSLIGTDHGARSRVARAIKKSPSWISGVLNGDHNPSYAQLDALAAHFELDVAELFAEAPLVSGSPDLPRQGKEVSPLRSTSEVVPHGASSRPLDVALGSLDATAQQLVLLAHRVHDEIGNVRDIRRREISTTPRKTPHKRGAHPRGA